MEFFYFFIEGEYQYVRLFMRIPYEAQKTEVKRRAFG